MRSNTSISISLCELVLGSNQAAAGIHINPIALKSILDSLIAVLAEQKIPAIIWAKLPRGEVWQAELDRYIQSDSPPEAVFLFKNQRENGADGQGIVSTTLPRCPFPNCQDEPDNSEGISAPVFSIPLSPESPLRREYFLVVWSVRFRGLVIAQRPHTEPIATEQGEDGQEKPHSLLTVCSFKPELIEQVLEGLEHIVLASRSHELPDLEVTLEEELSLPSDRENPTQELPDLTQELPDLEVTLEEELSLPSDQGNPTQELPDLDATLEEEFSLPSDLVNHWQTLMAALPLQESSLEWIEQLLIKQLQQQEESWQRSHAHRQQAEHLVEVLQLHNQELIHAIHLKDDFLNRVGQELRTPLTTIKTALTLLNSSSLKSPQRQRYMDLIAKECDRQSSLITRLLDLVQLDQIVDQSAIQPVRLVDVVPGVVSTYQPIAAEKGIRLTYIIPDELPPILCTPHWLKQIVINLLNNGIKFTPAGGQVRVRAKRQADWVQVEFRDTGTGIPTAEIPKIFDRFYRVRQSGDELSGAGLGLTIVQQLLLHCGGSISVQSKLSEGSTFTVLFPVYKSATESEQA